MRKINLEKYTFFDFDGFVNAVFNYYKQYANLIGLNENQIVSHTNEKPTGGLVIDIYLIDIVDNEQEYLSTKNISDIGINVELVLLGFSKATASKSYRELTERTLKLALITDKLSDYLNENGFQVFCTNVNTFQAVRDTMKATDTLNNGCVISFITKAYMDKKWEN